MTRARPDLSVSPTPDESATAKEAIRRIAPLISRSTSLGIRIPRSKETIALPALAIRLLMELLAEIARGNAVSVTPARAELTTQQAADLLGVSRPFMVELLETGRLPFRKIGTHRRVRSQDVSNLKILLSQIGTAKSQTIEGEAELRGESVSKRQRELGCEILGRPSPLSHLWTPEQLELLGKASDQHISRTIGLSLSAVKTRRLRLGIPAHRPELNSSAAQRLKTNFAPNSSVLGDKS